MLSDKSFPVIEATLPLVGSRIGEITPKFYARLFAAHPELLDGLFSRSNQRNGNQQQALAGSIAAFATHLVNNPGTLPETVLARIAHRHASLGITEPQYQVVYEHLFAAIAEDLAEVITPEIAEAWTEVYWLMADALIKLEKGLYAAQANGTMWSPWRVAAKTAAGTGSMTFTLEPADDTPITPALPGPVRQRQGHPSGRTAPGPPVLAVRRRRHQPQLHHQEGRRRRSLPRPAQQRPGGRRPRDLQPLRRDHPQGRRRPRGPGLGRHRLHARRRPSCAPSPTPARTARSWSCTRKASWSPGRCAPR